MIVQLSVFAYAQEVDTSYVREYPYRLKVLGYVSTTSLEIDGDGRHYSSNYPLTTGVGFALKNTLLGFQVGYGLVPLKSRREYGKSKTLDVRLHHYGRKFMLDVLVEDFKGFYSGQEWGKAEEIHPDMSVKQFGLEGSYLFNGSRLSSKAAFGLNEIQLQSAGSVLLGGGVYYYDVEGIGEESSNPSGSFENMQMGVNGGYAHSWPVSQRWMLSGMVKIGGNLGKATRQVQGKGLSIYPTAVARFASSYHKADWGLSMVVLLNSKSIYPMQNDMLGLTTVNMQLSYVKHLNNLFKRNHE